MTPRRRPRIRPGAGSWRTVLALGTALIVAGCASPPPTSSPVQPSVASSTGGSASPTAAAATPSPTATPTPSVSPSGPSPAATSSGTLAWADCGAPFECATLNVPLDYQQPAGRSISLSLIRLPAADPTTRIGSLLTNPGGPGGSGIDFVRQNAQALFSSDLRARFDIVGFDPRGVGMSTPVECVDGPTLDALNALDPIPDTAAERTALIDGAKRFDAGCQARSGDLLPFMSTADAARDMDQIRIALGEPKLTYLGFSYGTYLGTVYAGLYPKNIRAFVLDGALDPTLTFTQVEEAQGRSFERELNRFLADCASSSTCEFRNGGKPGPAFDALMASIDKHPLPARASGDPRPVGPGEAFTGVLVALYATGSWPTLAKGLALAQLGDGSILLYLADLYNGRQADGSYSNEAAANSAVNCLDNVAPTRLSAIETLAATYRRTAPRFGVAVAYSGLVCAFWPVRPTGTRTIIHAAGAPPILVVGTTGDPATPYAWAVSLAQQLSSGVLLTRKGEGHTAYGQNPCIDAAVDAYLIELAVPAAGTVCT